MKQPPVTATENFQLTVTAAAEMRIDQRELASGAENHSFPPATRTTDSLKARTPMILIRAVAFPYALAVSPARAQAVVFRQAIGANVNRHGSFAHVTTCSNRDSAIKPAVFRVAALRLRACARRLHTWGRVACLRRGRADRPHRRRAPDAGCVWSRT